MKIPLTLKYVSVFLLFSISSAYPMQWIKKQLPSKEALYSRIHMPQGVSSLFEHIKENTIKKHPYLTAAAIAIPVIVTALITAKRYFGSTNQQIVNQEEKVSSEPVTPFSQERGCAKVHVSLKKGTPALPPSPQMSADKRTDVEFLIDAFNNLANDSDSLNKARSELEKIKKDN